MSQMSGQVIASGVAQFPTDISALAVEIKAHPDNTDTVWVGNDGNDTISSSTGFPLNAGESVTVIFDSPSAESLGNLYVVADVDLEKVCWMLIDA